jgi:hypothetical protein
MKFVEVFMTRGLAVLLLVVLAPFAPGSSSSGNSIDKLLEPSLNKVAGISVDLTNGVLYLTDQGSSSIFRIATAGLMKPFAGTGSSGFNGDGRTALQTQFNHPTAISFDQRTEELFVADTRNYRIRVISSKDSTVRTVAGSGISTPPREIPYDPHTPAALAAGKFKGDGGPATEAELNLPSGVCADPVGILFIADSGNHRVRAVNRGTSPVILMGVDINPGEIQTIAGNGRIGYSGDGGKATLAQLAFPTELKVDASGSLFVVDSFNQRIRKIDRQSGIIHTVVEGYIADVPAQRALTQWATSIVGVGITTSQEIIYSDRVDNSIHRMSRGGDDQVIYRTQPHQAELAQVELGPDDQIYVADVHWNRVIRIQGTRIQTYVGNEPKPVLSFSQNKGPFSDRKTH